MDKKRKDLYLDLFNQIWISITAGFGVLFMSHRVGYSVYVSMVFAFTFAALISAYLGVVHWKARQYEKTKKRKKKG